MNIKNINKVSIINCLFYFIVISLSVGNFIAEINLLLITIFYLIYLITKKSTIELNFIFLYFLTFYAYICVNAQIQIDDNLKWSSFGYIRFILLSYFIYFFFKERLLTSKKTLFVLIIFFGFILLDSIFQFFVGNNLFNFQLTGDRVSGVFKDELILGSYCLKSFLVILSLIFINDLDILKNKNKIIFLFFLTYISIYISAERTSFIMLVLSIILLLILIKDLRQIIKNSLIFFIFFLLLISNVDLGQKSNPNAILIYKTFNQITNYKFAGTTPNKWLSEEFSNLEIEKKIEEVNEVEISYISHIHSGHYKLAKHLFEKNIIFGVGPRGFRNYCRKIDYNSPIGTCTTHPHNFFMQFMSELGIIGLLFYSSALIFFIYVFVKTIKIKNNSKNKKIILVLLVSIFVNFFPLAPSGDFFTQYHSFFNYLNFGILIFYLEKEKFIKNFKLF